MPRPRLDFRRALQTPADLRVAMEIAAERGDWKTLARMLAYLKEVHPNTPIPAADPALEAAVKCFKPGRRMGRLKKCWGVCSARRS